MRVDYPSTLDELLDVNGTIVWDLENMTPEFGPPRSSLSVWYSTRSYGRGSSKRIPRTQKDFEFRRRDLWRKGRT
jgi:hypothetical protein